ncbi:MAG: hypothetical protein RLY31_2709 [Bacteroidota bacterium]|jgi:antitoxin component YwqK of YwqJK toxin-antitoxin module
MNAPDRFAGVPGLRTAAAGSEAEGAPKTTPEKMKKRSLMFAAVATVVLAACTETEPVEVRDENGILTERYHVRRGTSVRHGRFERFHPEGQLYEESDYQDDTLQGEVRRYFPDGVLQSVETMVDGRFEGPYRKYYPSGQLKLEGVYREDAMDGIWRKYSDTGELAEEVTFAGNAENGPFRIFYRNGRIRYEGTYLGGDNEEGLLLEYDSAGTLVARKICFYGNCGSEWTLADGDLSVDTARLQARAAVLRRFDRHADPNADTND